MEGNKDRTIRNRLRRGIASLTMKIMVFYGHVLDRILPPNNANTEVAEKPKLVDRASAVITAAMLLIILVLFIVASVKLGLTFSSIWNDFKTFFYGT